MSSSLSPIDGCSADIKAKIAVDRSSNGVASNYVDCRWVVVQVDENKMLRNGMYDTIPVS